MKKKLLLIGLGVLAMSAGCGKREDDPVHILESRVDREGEEMGDVPSETASSETGDSQPDRDSQQESRQDSVSVPAEQEEGTPKPERGQTEAAGFSFGDLADWYFYFGSGVGAWSTELRIGSDGSFTGSYHDADMGDIGEGYPGGTYYFCGFEGSFKDLERVDRYTYKMKRDTLTYQEEPGTREIEDQVLWVYSEAAGLESGEEYYLYLPGAELAGLPEQYLQWVGYYDQESISGKTLPFYGIYNPAQEIGFSSYEYKEQSLAERIEMEISFAVDTGEQLEAELNEVTTQNEMNYISDELYLNWDNTLNIIWKLLEGNLPSEKMEAIRAEEREWIAYKEEEVKIAGQAYEGGSMKPMAESLRAAELTRERVYKLAEYAE